MLSAHVPSFFLVAYWTQDALMPALSPTWLTPRPQQTRRPPFPYKCCECRSISTEHLRWPTILVCPKLVWFYYWKCQESGNFRVLRKLRPWQQSFLGFTSNSHPLITSYSQTHPRLWSTWAFLVQSLALVLCVNHKAWLSKFTGDPLEDPRKVASPPTKPRGHISHTHKERPPGAQRGSQFIRLL